jgi:hypothetical protein
MLKRIRIILTLLCPTGLMAHGQALPAATRPAVLQVGGTYSFCYPDYTPQDAQGGGIYIDLDLSPHYGAELGFHQVDISQHKSSYERTYEFGGRYRRTYGRFIPYFKALAGRGVMNFPGPNNTISGNLAYNMAVGGAGVDVRVANHVNVRAEVEYQRWFHAVGLEHALNPILYNVGVAYHF